VERSAKASAIRNDFLAMDMNLRRPADLRLAR
jgi:hypothetical protein